jgi:hypothetical protein
MSDNVLDLESISVTGTATTQEEAIRAAGAAKADAFARGTALLASWKGLADASGRQIAGCIRLEKMAAAIERLLRGMGSGSGFRVTPGLWSGIGMGGRVYLDTYERLGDRVWYLEGLFETGHRFLACVLGFARRLEQPVQVAWHPLDPGRIEALRMPELGVAFVCPPAAAEDAEAGTAAEEDGQTVIKLRRFLDPAGLRAVRSALRQSARLREELLGAACDAYAEAAEAHFCLETLYAQAMDFSAKEAFTHRFCEKLADEGAFDV